MNRNVVRTVALALILSIGLTFTSCGKKKKKKPQYGGTATIGVTVEPDSFDPHISNSNDILFNIYESLFRYTKNGNLDPCLASEYSVSGDARTYTFTIKEEIKFHDGSDLDASDVVYSLKRASGLLDQQDGTPLIPELDVVSDVYSNDLGQVIVTLDSPNSELTELFTTAIIPDGTVNIAESKIGTGPFKFYSYEAGESLSLVRNDEYRNSKYPYLDSVTFKFYPDIDTAFADLQSGAIDILPEITYDMVQQLDPEQFTIAKKGSNTLRVFALNNDVAPFDDRRVRQAMNYALNRDEIITLSTGLEEGISLTTAMSPVMSYAYDPSLNGTYARDLTTARALMEQAGLSNGFDMTITVPDDSPVYITVAETVASQLSEIGIRASVVRVDHDTWESDVFTDGNYEATVVDLSNEFDAYDVLARYCTGSEDNFINYSDARFDTYYAQIPLTADPDSRLDLYHQLLRILTDDAVSCYIQDPYHFCAINKRVGGYAIYPFDYLNAWSIHVK